MTLPDIAEIRAEHEREQVGEAIYGLLRQVVRRVAVRYPPRVYSPAGAWDEGTLEELLQEWLSERLLRGDLELMIASAASAEALRNQLATSLTQLIVNRRRRDSAGNLYKRSLAMLKANPAFEQAGPGAPQRALWTLSERPIPHPSPLRLRALVRLAFELDDEELEVVRYGPHSLKSSPILREPALERFLAHLLRGAEGALTPARIAEVMQHRFSLVRERDMELDERLASGEPIELAVESSALAESALAQLDGSERARLRAIGEADWDLDAAAERRGEGESALRATARRLTSLVAEYGEDPEQAQEVMRKVIESLFVGDNDE